MRVPGDAPDPITVESRRMLLDALAVLAPHAEHIVLVGAHAIYLHTEDAVTGVVAGGCDDRPASAPDAPEDGQLVAGSRWADSGHVFATMLGRPHHAATITRCFQDALERAGLPRARFHDLRHSAATFLLAQGFTLEDVKNLQGTARSC